MAAARWHPCCAHRTGNACNAIEGHNKTHTPFLHVMNTAIAGIVPPIMFGRATMPRGEKDAYTDKQKRQARHIEESEKEAGKSTKASERIAWATVNKQDGGGKKSGSARKH